MEIHESHNMVKTVTGDEVCTKCFGCTHHSKTDILAEPCQITVKEKK